VWLIEEKFVIAVLVLIISPKCICKWITKQSQLQSSDMKKKTPSGQGIQLWNNSRSELKEKILLCADTLKTKPKVQKP